MLHSQSSSLPFAYIGPGTSSFRTDHSGGRHPTRSHLFRGLATAA
ncbi:hypothetical protein [Acetobacter persici]|nr:hypothetical protein [Acetobacter persici]